MKGTTSTATLAIRQLRTGDAKRRLPNGLTVEQARPMKRTGLHPSEERLASLRTYHTRRGPELRLVQARPAGHSLLIEVRAPRRQAWRPRTLMGVEIGGWREVRDILLGTLVIGGLFVGIVWLAGILQAAGVPA